MHHPHTSSDSNQATVEHILATLQDRYTLTRAAKETDHLNIPAVPGPPDFWGWNIGLIGLIVAATGRGQDATTWALEATNGTKTFAQLANSGTSWASIDAKLATGIMGAATGNLLRRLTLETAKCVKEN